MLSLGEITKGLFKPSMDRRGTIDRRESRSLQIAVCGVSG
jgi:hypothetical protein